MPGASIDVYKKQATALQAYLKEGGAPLKRAHALEAIAKIHGFQDFHHLSNASESPKHRVGVKDVTRSVKRMADRYEIELLGEVIKAIETEMGVFVAEGQSDGTVSARVLSARGNQKTYGEGDAVNNHCPPEILSILTPTSDPSCLIWREGAWIHALRQYLIDTSEALIPWILHSCMRDVDGFKPALAARCGIKSNEWSACDWKETRTIVDRDFAWSRGCDELGLNGETPLAGHEISARCPDLAQVRWFELCRAPFRVWVLVNRAGGYVTWTANPWHYSSSMTSGGGDIKEFYGRKGMKDDISLSLPVIETFARSMHATPQSVWDAVLEKLVTGGFDPAS